MSQTIEGLQKKIKKFADERDWDQYLNPKDVLIALVSEVGELAECLRWLNKEDIKRVLKDQKKKDQIEYEVADIMMFLLTFAYKTDINIARAVEKKMLKNAKKYPVELIKGKHTNPLEGNKH